MRDQEGDRKTCAGGRQQRRTIREQALDGKGRPDDGRPEPRQQQHDQDGDGNGDDKRPGARCRQPRPRGPACQPELEQSAILVAADHAGSGHQRPEAKEHREEAEGAPLDIASQGLRMDGQRNQVTELAAENLHLEAELLPRRLAVPHDGLEAERLQHPTESTERRSRN